ncbi:hypothetical protein JOM56_004998 [Amanita muscaria]
MSQTTLLVTRYAPPCSPTKKLTLTSPDTTSELANSISGSLAEYHFVSSAPGEVTITAIHSYKEQFRRTKADLLKVLEKNNKMEEDQDTLRRAQVYSVILSELNDIWFIQLPEDVRFTLSKFGKINLPSTFASWWLQWEEASPAGFPLPPSMRHFGPVNMNSAAHFIFDSTQQESNLSKAITRAWEAIPDTSRQLMLFCWSGLHSVQLLQNEIAHPNMENSSAKAILRQDFGDNFESLHAAAGYMADYLFSD